MTKIRKQVYDDFVEITAPTPTAIDLEEIASGTVTTPDAGTKSLFLDSLDSTLKTKDENGVIEALGSGSGGGLQPVFIDHTSIPAELVRNRIYEADFSGAAANSTLVVTFPEGTGSETFILGFRITGLSQGSTVTFQTTNSQNIFFPDGTTDTTITNINAKTYFEFAWDQSRYVYGDVDSPTFADLSASLGPVEVDTLTADSVTATTYNNLPVASDSLDGIVNQIEQNFAGRKNFNSRVTATSFEHVSTVTPLANSPTAIADYNAQGLSGIYLVTCSRGANGASYSAASISIVACTTSSSAIVSELRADPDCVITASGGTVYAQTPTYIGQDFKSTFVPLMRFEII